MIHIHLFLFPARRGEKKINAFPLMHFRTPGEGKCIKIPLDKMWSLILCWGAGDRVNTYSIISQSHPSRRAPPPCHYVSPSHQPPAGFHVPAAISPLIQKHVSAWQKQGAESHFMRSLRRRRGSGVKRKFKVVKRSENQRVKAVFKNRVVFERQY